jgi:hypothetical protein
MENRQNDNRSMAKLKLIFTYALIIENSTFCDAEKVFISSLMVKFIH